MVESSYIGVDVVKINLFAISARFFGWVTISWIRFRFATHFFKKIIEIKFSELRKNIIFYF